MGVATNSLYLAGAPLVNSLYPVRSPRASLFRKSPTNPLIRARSRIRVPCIRNRIFLLLGGFRKLAEAEAIRDHS